MLIAELLNFKMVMPFAVFGLFAAAAWWGLEFIGSKNRKTEQRLDDFKDPSRRKKAESVKEASVVSRVIQKTTPALSRPFQPTNEKAAGKLKLSLQAAGFRSETAPSIFLGFKFIALMIGLITCGGGSLLMTGISKETLIQTLIGGAIFFYIPTVVLWFITKRRKDQIFFGLPDTLDLMVVCVEAGLALDQAMRKVTEEMNKTFPILSEEFGIANFQLQMGRSRSEVLQELGRRTGVDDLRTLAAILIQADKFGSSIAQALRVQSDSMRTRRQQLAEEKAAKTAVKLIFPLVLFIFPGIFVVLVGPAAIQMVNQMLPTMNG